MHLLSLIDASVKLGSLSEAGLISAVEADGGHFLDLLCHRDQINQISELVALEISIEARYDHSLPLVSNLVNDLGESATEELGFVNSDDISLAILLPLKEGLIKLLSDQSGFLFDLIVCHHAKFATFVPHVTLVFDEQNILLCYSLSCKTPQKLCALSREHGSHY